jgi:glycosyltransferase involved in cell wall biosynthesis
MSKPTELVYVLPKYDLQSAEHFYHLYSFLEGLGERVGLMVVVERMSGQPRLAGDVSLVGIRAAHPILRLWEELIRFLLARLRGVRKFYVHYSYTAAIAAGLVTRVFGGECFYWNCGLYREFAPGKDFPLRVRLAHARQVWLLEQSLRLCTWLVTGSPRMAEYYAQGKKSLAGKIRVLPNFVDAARFQSVGREEARRRLGLPSSQAVFLFLHRVSLRKGAGYLPALAERLSLHLQSFTLLVAGDGPYLAELREQVRARRLADWFDFRGRVPNREVPLLYRAADVYLMPSREEGFPHVLLEAMAAGCPFVGFDVGGVRDLVSGEQLACIVPAGDLDRLVSESLRILADPNDRQGLIEQGYRCVERFSQERVLRAFLDLIRGHPLGWREFQTPEGMSAG